MSNQPLRVKLRNLADLKPYSKNPRAHTEDQIAKVAASMEEFGWTNPILIDEKDRILAGHARALAAQHLGRAQVPTILIAGLTAAQKRAYTIADNKTTDLSYWDNAILAGEMEALMAADFDLVLTGFSQGEIDYLTDAFLQGTEGETDEDETPEIEEEVVTKTGDIWLCGRHRLRCGDSTKAEDVEALLAGVEPHLCVTDPPYGVEYDPAWRQRAAEAGHIAYGAVRLGNVPNDDRVDWFEAWDLFPGQIIYVWHAGLRAKEVQESLERAKFNCRNQIIWAKPRFVISRGHYHIQHEPCWYAVRKGANGHWAGDRSQTTLWTISHGKSDTGHGTQKPVECMRRPIMNNSNPGQAVYDPFLGSGTTMIAAEKEGRVCYGMEIAPQYCDVSVRRWQNFTGDEATIEGDGRTFDEVAKQRCKTKKSA